jgi:hypothetical protein
MATLRLHEATKRAVTVAAVILGYTFKCNRKNANTR